MRNIKNMKTKLAIMASVAALAMYASGAMADTVNVTADIAFEAPVALTLNNDIDFGFVTALQANTYAIDATTATVTTTGGAGTGVWLGGTTAAADIDVVGSATQTVAISIANYTANNNVTPSLATCKYGAAAEAACNGQTGLAAPGAGTTLLVGASVTANGTQAAGTAAAPTFDLTVVYG